MVTTGYFRLIKVTLGYYRLKDYLVISVLYKYFGQGLQYVNIKKKDFVDGNISYLRPYINHLEFPCKS